jgi:hypothetical protein
VWRRRRRKKREELSGDILFMMGNRGTEAGEGQRGGLRTNVFLSVSFVRTALVSVLYEGQEVNT